MGKRKYHNESQKRAAMHQRAYEKAIKKLEESIKDNPLPRESFMPVPRKAWALKLKYTKERILEVLSYQRYEPDLAKILGIWNFKYREAVFGKGNILEVKRW